MVGLSKMEQDDQDGCMVVIHTNDQVLIMENGEREKTRWAQGEGIARAILVLHSRHHRGCE